MPRRPSLPSEKIMAVAGIYKALGQELHSRVDQNDARVQVALINAAVAIGLATNTTDMGIVGETMTPPAPVPCDHILKVNAAYAHPCVLEAGHEEAHVWSDDVFRTMG